MATMATMGLNDGNNGNRNDNDGNNGNCNSNNNGTDNVTTMEATWQIMAMPFEQLQRWQR